MIGRIRKEMVPFGLTTAIIRAAVIAFVQGGGIVHQVKERRKEWKDKRENYYKVILPTIGSFKKGLFVEMELSNADTDYPEVRLVNAHEQS